jgi:hypothetical protein
MTSRQPAGKSKPSKKEKEMALLDLQGMELSTEATANANGGGSRASLLLCGDSSLSVTTCN